MAKIKPYNELTFTDDFMFGKVMQYPEICKHVLELVLNIKIRSIVYLESQKILKPSYEAKGIRMDVYVDDDQHSVYNVEMQTQHFAELPKRSRYYQSIVDLDMLATGQDYNELKNSIIIFLCTGDPFGEKRCFYTFENTCKEDPTLKLGDGTKKIFINAAGFLDRNELRPELKPFLDYISTGEATDEFTKQLERAVDHVKNNKDYEVSYMTLALKIMDERREARIEGIKEARIETCRKALRMNLPLEDIMELTGLTSAEIQAIAAAQ